MFLEDAASDGLRENVARLECSLNELNGCAFSLADFLMDQLVFCVPMLGPLALTVCNARYTVCVRVCVW